MLHRAWPGSGIGPSARTARQRTAPLAYWQVSRIYALLGQADNARRYGELCLEVSQEPGVQPFYLAYAHEALARAGHGGGQS